MSKLIIKIVDSGTIYRDQINGDHRSLTGHMWWELYDDSREIIGSYGFSPADGYDGKPLAPGSVKYDDNTRYDFNILNGDYKKELEITDSQFEKLRNFGEKAFEENKFDSYYNGFNNSCIDFTWTALAIAGLITIDENGNYFDGDLIPTWNIDNIEKLASEGLEASFQKKDLTTLNTSLEEYISFVESYYSVKTINQNNFQNLLTKYSLNSNLNDYSNSIPTIIINDGNGNNFNLSAFPDFSVLLNQEIENSLDQFTTSFLDSALVPFDYDLEQFNQFLNSNQLSLNDFKSEFGESVFGDELDSEYNFSSSFDKYFEQSFLNDLNLNTNLFDVELSSEGGNYEAEFFVESEEFEIEEPDFQSFNVFAEDYAEFNLGNGTLEDYLFEQGYRSIEDLDFDLEVEYGRISDIFANDLESEQTNLIDKINADLENFIAANPNASESDIISFAESYNHEWSEIVSNLVTNWEIDADNLLSEYESYVYYDPNSINYEYFDGNPFDAYGAFDWQFDPTYFDGENLYGFGYYKEIPSFYYASIDEFSDYWQEFDSNGDDLINEGEYDEGENFDYFAQWYDNSDEYWLDLEESFNEALNVRLQEIWVWGYKEIYAFDPRDMGEYEDYWQEFDYNGDGLIDEYEYEDDRGYFMDWYWNEWIWESPSEAYEYAHDVNFDEYWVESEILLDGFEVDSTEFGDYWREFDYNGDDIIDEEEYLDGENYDAFENWYINSEKYWQSLETAFENAVYDVNFDENYAYVEDEYNMLDYWEVRVGASFNISYMDFSDLRFDNFVSSSFWKLDLENSWQPSEIFYNVNFNANFNFEINSINQVFDNFLYSVNYQPFFNLPFNNLNEFYNQNYSILSGSSSIIEGGNSNEIVTSSISTFKINAAGGSDIINGDSQDEEINGEDGNDILVGGAGNNILIGGNGNDIYVLDSSNLANDEIIDDGGMIFIDNKIFAGVANQVDLSANYKIGEYVIVKNGNNLHINYGSDNSFVIKDFVNGRFGINLNHNPNVNIGEISLNEDEEIIINLKNESSDLDEDNLSFKYSTESKDGEVVEIENGILKYKPKTNFNGSDKIEILVSDEKGGYLTKTINITVASANDLPTVLNSEITTNKNRPTIIKLADLLTNAYDVEDGEAIKSISFANVIFTDFVNSTKIYNSDGSYYYQTTNAKLTISEANNHIIYQPNKNYFGSQTISYQIKDSDGSLSNVATINFNVTNLSKAPQELIDAFDEDFYLTIYTDVKNAISNGSYKANALHHFINYGYKEGRTSNLEDFAELKFPNSKEAFLEAVSNFDENFYLTIYNDVKNAINNGSYKATALHHFINYGYKEGRFSSADYANRKNGTINNDIINGDDYNNIIRGDAGDDIIIGKKGSDLLTGGQGSDIFKYFNLNESTINTSDLITDFTKGEDKIDLSELDFLTVLSQDQLNQEDTYSNFSSNQNLTYSYNQENNQTIIQNQEQNFQIKLTGNINLDDGDFGF